MIEEQGRVISSEGSSEGSSEEKVVWVETERKTTCSSCSARHGCGQHLAEKYRPSSAFAYIRASSDWSLAEGDRVLVGIPENSLLKASVVVYLLPLLLVLAALWLSQAADFGDGITLMLSALGLVVGFIPARKLGAQEGDMCRVKVVRVLSRESAPAETLSIRSA